MQKAKRYLRLLAIEDNDERLAIFKTWLTRNSSVEIPVRLVCAQSAGQALGVLSRDKGRVFSGIMLDHDLQENIRSPSDLNLSGSNVVNQIITNISRMVPVLVHSMNPVQGQNMATRLNNAGYSVTRIPFADLDYEKFLDWFEYVRDLWEDQE